MQENPYKNIDGEERSPSAAEADADPGNLDEEDWEILLERISEQKCTPFIGPGIYSDMYSFNPLVRDWSQHPQYPFTDFNNLTLAAQFRAVLYDPVDPKDKIIKRLEALATPDFRRPNESHRILASLPLSYYITTNFDDFMLKALEFRNKSPRRDMCRWNDPEHSEELSIFKSGYVPNVANPLVFHLYGYSYNKRNSSLVLTEDDYLDFIANVSKFPKLIPPLVQAACTDASVLLLGYRLDDWNFRILFRTLVSYMKFSPYKGHLSVQLVPVDNEAPQEQKAKARKYFKRYLNNHNFSVTWKTCQGFIEELKARWENSGYGN